MGISSSSATKSREVANKETEISLEVEEWLNLRNNTISELNRVADELDNLHRKATYSKVLGGVSGALGGGIALGGVILSVVTGGTSLLLTGVGLTLAAGGGVTVTVAEVVELLKKRTRVEAAQKALEKDKATQAALLAKIEVTLDGVEIDIAQKVKLKTTLQNFVNGVAEIWMSGAKVYGWAKSGQAIYSVVKCSQAGSSVWKVGAKLGLKRSLMSVGSGLASSIFILVDVGYVIHHAIQISKGTPSDAAKSIRGLCRLLTEERDKVLTFLNSH